MKKKREYHSSELTRAFAKIHGFENKLLAFEVRSFLKDYLKKALYAEIETVNLNGSVLEIRVRSPLLRHDFNLRRTFLLDKFKAEFPEAKFTDLRIL